MAEIAQFDILNLLLVLVLAWLFGKAAERVGYPAMMGELLAGIVFGPALLGFLHPSVTLDLLAELGVFLLMVYVGMEMDVRDLLAVRNQSTMVALGGLLLPFAMGWWLGAFLGFSVEAALFVGIAMAATSLATKSRILVDLELLDTKIARVMVGAALLSDIGVLIIFAGIIGFIEVGTLDLLGVVAVMAKAILFFVVSIAVGLYVFPILWKRLQRLMDRHGFIDKTSAFTVFLLVALTFAGLAILAGLHMIIGGFMAGLFLREVHLREDIFDHMYNVVYDLAIGFFAPIFFVVVTFQLTLAVFFEAVEVLVLFVVVAFASKIVGSWLFALPVRVTSREALVVGFGMNGRGVVEIVIASVALSAGILSEELFSILVFLAIFTTALVPPTVKWGVDWLARRGELIRDGPGSEPS